jgi:hypothetical protein
VTETVLYVLLRYTESDCHFGIFKLFNKNGIAICNSECLPNEVVIRLNEEAIRPDEIVVCPNEILIRPNEKAIHPNEVVIHPHIL